MFSTQSAFAGHRFENCACKLRIISRRARVCTTWYKPANTIDLSRIQDYSITPIKLGSTIPYINCINQGFVHFVTFFLRGLTSVKGMLKHPQANQWKSVYVHNMFCPDHRLGMQPLKTLKGRESKMWDSKMSFLKVKCSSPWFQSWGESPQNVTLFWIFFFKGLIPIRYISIIYIIYKIDWVLTNNWFTVYH